MSYPRLTWRPTRTESREWFVDRMSHYTNRLKAFLLYRHGTVVYDGGPNGPSPAVCDAALADVVTHSPDFSVMPMLDGNFLVRFRGPVFGLVSGAFAKENMARISAEATSRGLLPGEAILQPDAALVKAGHHVIGLYARASLYLDAESPIVVAKFVPCARNA